MAELDRCWRGPRERRIRVTPRAPYYPYTHILTRPLMYIGWTTSHFVIMFCLRDVLFLSVFCFVLFDCLFVCLFVLINEANWWTWDSQIRWCLEIPSMTQPRPHCAFPWLLDKLRWTQAMVTAASHFLVQNRVRILRTGQHTPTKNFQEYPLGDLKPGSKFTCQHPLANYQML